MLDKNTTLPYNYQSEIGYDTLIQDVVLKETINLTSILIVKLDIELILKISRINYLESINSTFFKNLMSGNFYHRSKCWTVWLDFKQTISFCKMFIIDNTTFNFIVQTLYFLSTRWYIHLYKTSFIKFRFCKINLVFLSVTINLPF